MEAPSNCGIARRRKHEQRRERMWRVSGRLSMGAMAPEEVKLLASPMGVLSYSKGTAPGYLHEKGFHDDGGQCTIKKPTHAAKEQKEFTPVLP
jgi:hypothetical protein